MKQQKEVNNNLLAKIELKYLLSAVIIGFTLFIICCEFIIGFIFVDLTQRTRHYISIGFISGLVITLFYLIIKFYRGAGRDFSTRLEYLKRDLKEERDKFSVYLEGAPYGVFTADEDGKFIEVNQAVVEMTGYSKEELLQSNFFNLYPPRLRKEAEEVFEGLKVEGQIEQELTWITRQGCPKRFRIKLVKLATSQIVGFVEDIVDENYLTKELKPDNKFIQPLATVFDFTEKVERESEINKSFLQLLNLNLEEDEEEIDQMKYTREIHNQLLPYQFPDIEDFSIAGLYQPAERMGGDFYYVVELKEKIIFYLADITGNALEGTFLNIFLRETINSYLFQSYRSEKEISPAEAVKFITARYREEDFAADYFISLVLFVMDKETKQVKYTNFGFQVPPLLVRSGEIKELNLTGLPISTAVEMSKYDFAEKTFKLEIGDELVVVTDGLIKEQQQNSRYGVDRLKEIIKEYYHLPSELMLQTVKVDFKNFMGSNKQQDDISILAVERVEVIDKFELKIASGYELIELVKKEFMKFIKPYHKEVDRMLIGLHEMIANAIEHGNKEDRKRKVKIRAVVNSDYIKVEIKDEGSGFKWENKLKGFLEYDDFSERGRGIAITKLAFDRVCYNPVGNKVVLYKKR